MGTVVVFRNPTNLNDHRVVEFSGPFIDFLTEQFPGGFLGEHVTAVNLQKLDVCDYDRKIQEKDIVTLVVFPATGVDWVAVAIYAVVIAALAYAAMALYTPVMATPTSPAYTAAGGLPSADTVYSFSGAANSARIGQTIPVAYGRNTLAPDLAMAPYSYFEGNQQYLIHLECLGQGNFTLHETKIAGSDVDQLGTDVISVLHYPPASHGQTFGTIQNQTGRYENVYTSPSVSDQELYASTGAAGLRTSANLGTWFWNKWTYPWMDFSVPVPEYADGMRAGRAVYLHVLDGCNEGVWNVGFLFQEVKKTPALNYRRGHLALNGPWWNCGGPANVILSFSPDNPSDAGGTVGPFVAAPPGHTTTNLQYDVVFPNGCYSVSGTSLAAFSIQITFYATPIDDNGDVIGAAIAFDYSDTMATNTPQRRTLYHTVPNARYQVSAQRLTPLSGVAGENSRCLWTGLKSILGHPTGGPAYGDVTLLSVKIKATEGLASNAHQSLTVDCTRTGITTPTQAFQDIVTNQIYGARRPVTEVDTVKLASLASAWSGKTFDAVFDQETTVWDALKLSLQMQSAYPITNGSVISVVSDEVIWCANVALRDNQIKSVIMAYRFSELSDYDGVEGEYKNPDDNAAEFVTEPYDAVNPEQIVLWGCKDRASALAFVQRYWKQVIYRRRTLTIELEGDGNALLVGDVVDVTYSLLNLVGLRCIVTSIKPTDEFSTTVEATVYQPEVFA